MKVLIGTPAGNGWLSTQYVMSFISTLGFAIKNGIQPVLYTLAQESLLPRGRNHIAQVCMREKYDKLFFIDADSGWFPEQFMHIVSSPFPIVAGCVPLKTYPIVLNYLPFREDEKYFINGLRTPEATRKMREGYGKAEIPVAFTGTAFLCIDVSVLHKLSEKEQTYQYPNPSNGQQETHWDFFGGGPMSGTYYSEDWAFCKKAREAGYDVRINADIMINHVGNHVFQVHNRLPVDHAPEIFRPLLYRVANAKPNELIEIEKEVIKILGDNPEAIQNIKSVPQTSVSKNDGVKSDAASNPQ
jgi:hypothetical protein